MSLDMAVSPQPPTSNRLPSAAAIRERRSKGFVHIVSEFSNPTGGTELRAINLYKLLSKHVRVKVWSIDTPPPGLSAEPITKIITSLLRFPRGGTLVLVGSYFALGTWLKLARPKRVVLIYNTPDPDRLINNIARIKSATGLSPEVRFTSETLKMTVQIAGPIETSLIDLTSLLVIERDLTRPFTVGRLSRAEEIKFHEDDAALFGALAAEGTLVRIMGPSKSIELALRGVRNIELLPCGAESLDVFLKSIDCFVYRTKSSWDEPWGRVIVEAMAAGLPVVCEPRGGYKELVADGSNGFFFRDNIEAKERIDALRASASMRSLVGVAARQTAQQALSERVRAAILASYL